MKYPKDAPKIIYLQHDPENEGGAFSEADGITWCVDRINDNDIEYIRLDIHKMLIANMRKRHAATKF